MPKRITNTPRGVKLFAWRPNGEDIAFVAEDEPDKNPVRRNTTRPSRSATTSYLAKEAALPAHLWLVSAARDTATTIDFRTRRRMYKSALPETDGLVPRRECHCVISQPRPILESLFTAPSRFWISQRQVTAHRLSPVHLLRPHALAP